MMPREQAAYDAGLRAALDMARIITVTIEAAPDAADLRKRAAVGALHAFVDAAGALAFSQTSSPGHAVMATIASLPGDAGEIPCFECSGRSRWIRDGSNGHVHGACEARCFAVMQ